MRIALLHAPPWKLEDADDARAHHPLLSDTDFLAIPMGLLSLHAQATRAGHDVTIVNLANFLWPQVERVIAGLDAALFGLSCFTANRQGVAAAVDLIRTCHADAHIVVGGPFATALPREMLNRHKAIDTVVIGEGEVTFLELVDALTHSRDGHGAAGIAGTAWREGDSLRLEPPRERLKDLDGLASPHAAFPTPTVLTSRGCFGRCTFCASRAIWGRKITSLTVDSVLDVLESAVNKHGLRTLAFKDEVFTSRRSRVLQLCRGIADRKLRFLWSCDTRVDRVDDEMLRAMRAAGCEQVSFGVESGSPEILADLRKTTTPEQVKEATAQAKQYGLEVRFFMLWGSRNDTPETLKHSIDLIEAARPTSYAFLQLAVSPGTEEHARYVAEQDLPYDFFFDADFLAKGRLDRGSAQLQALADALGKHRGLHECWSYGLEDRRAVLDRLPETAAAHLDLGAACCRAARPDEAEDHLRRALELEYPLPAIAWSYLACVAALRDDPAGAERRLERAAEFDTHSLVQENLKRLEAWRRSGGPFPKLVDRHRFAIEGFLPMRQPVFPGPIEESALV